MKFRDFRRNVMHMTQMEMAEELGVTQTTISFWEKEKSAPPYKKLKEMQKRYNVDLEF